jgi:hypothetical protein
LSFYASLVSVWHWESGIFETFFGNGDATDSYTSRLQILCLFMFAQTLPHVILITFVVPQGKVGAASDYIDVLGTIRFCIQMDKKTFGRGAS